MVGTVQPSNSTFALHSWILYGFLILLRICAAPFLPGYVHPDEFFQGGQELWFGCPPATPWEFEPENALRSVVPPMIMTMWPLKIYSYFIDLPIEQLSGWQVWIIPRVACAIFSVLAVDHSVWTISEAISPTAQRSGVPPAILIMASAWPTMVLLNRPFSNAMETWVLALLLRTALHEGRKGKNPIAHISILQCLLFGVLSALGIFTRFTFVCFAFPIVLYFGFRMLRTLRSWEWPIKPTITCAAFLLATKLIIGMDSAFYSTRKVENGGKGGDIYITPWNGFSYNSRVDNLQDHGLHPRWTHAVVNMFILYGPMTLASYSFLLLSPWRLFQHIRNNVDGTMTGRSGKQKMALVLYQSIVVCGLGLLSLAPHQEPRFLLPLITPLVLLVTDQGMHRSIPICSIWIIFNIVLLVIFGVLHQGGVVRSLLALGSILVERRPELVIFYHTYMPPTFLSRRIAPSTSCFASGYGEESCMPAETACQDISLLDLDGSHNISSLRQTLKNALPCNKEENHGISGKHGYVHLVANPLQELEADEEWHLGWEGCSIPGMTCEIVWTYAPHLATEDLPSLASLEKEGLPFSVYELSCA